MKSVFVWHHSSCDIRMFICLRAFVKLKMKMLPPPTHLHAANTRHSQLHYLSFNLLPFRDDISAFFRGGGEIPKWKYLLQKSGFHCFPRNFLTCLRKFLMTFFSNFEFCHKCKGGKMTKNVIFLPFLSPKFFSPEIRGKCPRYPLQMTSLLLSKNKLL